MSEAMTRAPLWEVLRSRREELGATVEELAEWSSLAAEQIREIEDGGALAPAQLRRLAKGLAVSPSALLKGDVRDPRRSFARFRAAAPGFDLRAHDLRVLAVAAELGRVGGALLEMLGESSPITKTRNPMPPDPSGTLWREGYRLGEAARQAFKLPSDPVSDVEAALVDFGVHVGRAQFSNNDIDAASLWEPGAIPVILLNTGSHRNGATTSRRAVLAHELGHLLHDSGEADLLTQVSAREGTGNWKENSEVRARGFAPGFLAPRDLTRHSLHKLLPRNVEPERIVAAIASYWGLSLIGATWHAKNSDLISASQADELAQSNVESEQTWVDKFEQGRSVDEPFVPGDGRADLIEEEPSPQAEGLVAALAARAAGLGTISAGRCREIFELGT